MSRLFRGHEQAAPFSGMVSTRARIDEGWTNSPAHKLPHGHYYRRNQNQQGGRLRRVRLRDDYCRHDAEAEDSHPGEDRETVLERARGEKLSGR
jgi:hypothetical protein